ncbi:MAG: GTPase, partial [Deltaproteobacteria bacterium]|nr:GTPase [Deltaproteobacteria bacterium]
MSKRVVIMGAAGRDFHNFNLLYRDNSDFNVIAFTATQIPYINDRTYPPSLAGTLYPNGIPVIDESELTNFIKENNVDIVVFSYSDVTHEHVMHKASQVIASGADFILPSATSTMLKSSKPVISVTAVRTGCGKSGVTRFIAQLIKDNGLTPVAVRHPMPYGNLEAQTVQRFTDIKEMEAAKCTIEEREEYEPLTEMGVVVYAGVDYGLILKEAEKEADIIIWDGGNNDLPFYQSDLEITILDPLRAGDEVSYHPGEANLLRAEVAVINKANVADTESIKAVTASITAHNDNALIIQTDSVLSFSEVIDLKGKKVLVIEDGPTLTHGGMRYGAGFKAIETSGAMAIDPRPFAVGATKDILNKYPELENIVPAMGYSEEQIKDLEATINSSGADFIIAATPVDLARIIT